MIRYHPNRKQVRDILFELLQTLCSVKSTSGAAVAAASKGSLTQHENFNCVY